MIHSIIKTILGLASLATGVYGFYAIGHTAMNLTGSPITLIGLLLISTAMAFLGIQLIAEPELKEKIQTKLSEVK